MEAKKTDFTQPVGSFMEAVRRQLAYQREKRERIAGEEEYWQQEAERAKDNACLGHHFEKISMDLIGII